MESCILLICSDRLLAHIYAEELQARGIAGSEVVGAANGESALRLVSAKKPIAIILDLILPTMTGMEVLRTVRGNPASRNTPVVILPTANRPLARSAEEAGATWVLQRKVNPVAELADAVHVVLRLPRANPALRREPFIAPEPWRTIATARIRELFGEIGSGMQSLLKNAGDRLIIRSLVAESHTLTERLYVAGFGELCQLSAACELFLEEQLKFPERLALDTLKTLSQSLDFMTSVLDDQSVIKQILPPSQGRVLVMDPDKSRESAIRDALSLVGLGVDVVQIPAHCLSALANKTYHLAILNLSAGDTAGFRLVSSLRSVRGCTSLPIAFIAGGGKGGAQLEAGAVGGNDTISGLFSVTELAIKALYWVFRYQAGKM